MEVSRGFGRGVQAIVAEGRNAMGRSIQKYYLSSRKRALARAELIEWEIAHMLKDMQ